MSFFAYFIGILLPYCIGYVMSEEILSRIFEKVKKHETGCWEWLGNDHFQIWLDGKPVSVRRELYKHFRGHLRRLALYPSCDEVRCVNPAHLVQLKKIGDLQLGTNPGGRPQHFDPAKIFERTNLLFVNKKTGCWDWRCNNIEAAKRRSYQLFIADDNYRGKLEQTCGNELCVNPLHLEKA